MRNSMTQNQILERIDEELGKRELIIDLIDKENYQGFGSSIINQTFQLSQWMIGFFAIMEGYECDKNGTVVDPRDQQARPLPSQRLLLQLDDYIPEKYTNLLLAIRTIRDKAAHAIGVSYEDYVDCLDALNSFSLWFVTNEDVLDVASEDQRRSFSKRRVALEKRIISRLGVDKSIFEDSLGFNEKSSSKAREAEIQHIQEKSGDKKTSKSVSRSEKKVAAKSRKSAVKSGNSASKPEKCAPEPEKKTRAKTGIKKEVKKEFKKEAKAQREKAKSVAKQAARPSLRPRKKPLLEAQTVTEYGTSMRLHDNFSQNEVVASNTFVLDQLIAAGDVVSNAIVEKLVPKFDMLSNQIKGLSKQIENLRERLVDYQTLMQRQLDAVSSEEAKEQILSAFTEVLIEKINSDVMTQYDKKDYNNEKEMLQKSFGDTWKKLQPATQKFLASAKVLYKHQCKLGDQTDYSGVCVLITKSLEVELSQRFYTDFMGYLMENCVRPGITNAEKYLDFPTFMLKWKKPLKAKDFSLGSVAYFFCYKRDDKLTDEQWENNKSRLVEYCKSELLSKYNEEEILQLLREYAEAIETVRIDYRNPSAHTDMLQEINAKECMDLVVDVEKLLKHMVDSFDK